MYLGIEIGGTKLQVALADGDSHKLLEVWRDRVVPAAGANGILRQLESVVRDFCQRYSVRQLGIGFGGPVNSQTGVVFKSHQIDGWDDIDLKQWARSQWRLPAAVRNDCDCAALGESRYGAGQGIGSMFYVTVGTGIGGGWIRDGQIHGSDRPAASEIGHLRLHCQTSGESRTVEDLASGTGIANLAKQARREKGFFPGINEAEIDSRWVADRAAAGDAEANQILTQAIDALGWGVAQMITLLAPQRVIIGGGVSLLPRDLFLDPVRLSVQRYVFPALIDSYDIQPAGLGEEVVLHGAIALARDEQRDAESV